LNNLNNPNKYTGGNGVYSGIYTDRLGEILFSTENLFNPETGEGVIGKHYLGQGDHLFQINTDPTSEYYGYYYYDAKLNAASYNQTDQRFYVYDYLARTSDSANNNDAGKYSDFLPLNSPYANTNGQTIKTYNYDGENGEYSGISHYVYDARYDGSGAASNQVKANLWFGMRVDVQFGLPDTPGTKLPNGEYGNKDLYGNDMHFKFTGDDDVWILVDGKVVLDLGGIHQAAEGDINFATGEVRVNGSKVGTLSGIAAGEHTLTILYLERGSSMSNCAIYFNLAPRFSLTLQKEDVLTQEVLSGAQFAFYYDQACTQPCELWTSQQSYKNGDEPTNVFTIQNGAVYIWGLSPSRTYYIREVTPPTAEGYYPSRGVIQLTLDKSGLNSHSATIVEEVDVKGNKIPISHGFTLHNFRIDEENQAAYIVITNAQDWVKETTSVYVEKKWGDSKDHSLDSVVAYLNIVEPDGTVRRIREIVLSEENDWKYTWINLPKYALDESTMTESTIPVQYSVSEAYVPGYMPELGELQNGTYVEEIWAESLKFTNGTTYILRTKNGYLSTVSDSKNSLCWVDEATAKESPLALWTATVSSGKVKLTNQAGQSINYYGSGSNRYFNATTGSSSSQNLATSEHGGGLILSYTSGRTTYYAGNLNQNSYLSTSTGTGSALVIYPMSKTLTSTTIELDGYGYRITNSPLETDTSLTVNKRWDSPNGDQIFYEKEQVTVRLYANGVDTGRTETLSLKSNWTAVFNGLPYLDEDGEVIVYTVVETWETPDWIPTYSPVTSSGGEVPQYSVTVTNSYRCTVNYELPYTFGIGTYF
ncbi:MAG: Cna B-type domain-containing protein, partial [Agathobacter sp.]|nr:Cna B-type domain-containing protein [Agathobacter sp.]